MTKKFNDSTTEHCGATNLDLITLGKLSDTEKLEMTSETHRLSIQLLL